MRVTSIAVVALLTGAVIAGKKLMNGDCNGATLDGMSKDAIDTCAITLYDPTADYPVWDESQDFSCSMCPPKKKLLKLKKKKMSNNPDKSLARSYPIQPRGLLVDLFKCADCLVTLAGACAAVVIGGTVCCPCFTVYLIKRCIDECTEDNYY
ncbi:hypothetical protein LX32DRAFT_375688 [Colletotrichum zoysiae]|uniref:Uncharacterized protein n=1 Tax=Colletotrichum zoysiae TaxID=1216348 RepID=A0AAD9HJI0_9PEZI|nr:hypothetical protein LX32DRAFT_375688 [Colletotrichum zoysiae]